MRYYERLWHEDQRLGNEDLYGKMTFRGELKVENWFSNKKKKSKELILEEQNFAKL